MKLLRKVRFNINAARKIAKRFGRTSFMKLFILCDALFCRFFWNCTYDEYCIYEFYKYRNSYRKNFILQYKKTKYYSKINPYRYTMHKKVFYKAIQSGMKREIVYLSDINEQEFVNFVKKHKKIITKPDVGSRGVNIRLLEYTDDQQVRSYYNSLDKDTICEEYICQHDKLSSLNPNSVNTVRIVALCDNGTVEFVAASLKCGKFENSIVDNMHNNGIGANVDIQTGVVSGKGYDYNDHTFIYHPYTGTQIVGFAVPFWAETLELVRKTHLQVSECPLLGWDVAITKSGPEIVEINGAPGPKLMQLMDQKPKAQILKDYIKNHRIKK